MRPAGNLLLAAATAIAAMAFMAPAAAYGQSVELVDESSGLHCSNIVEEANHDVSSGCEVLANSFGDFTTIDHSSGISEVITTQCESELEISIHENGTGYIDTSDTTIHTSPPPSFSPCPFTACDEAAPNHSELEWPISGIFEHGGSREKMLMTFCLRVAPFAEGSFNAACTIMVDGTQDPTTHVITFGANSAPCHEDPTDELSGTWITNGYHDEIELVHLHYPGD